MKTQIIHLEPTDDVSSVLDKINWAKAERLVLVWPGRNRVLTNKLDLRLIQRRAQRRGAQIGLVSLDPDVRTHADSLNIPIFETLDTFNTEIWSDSPTSAPTLPERTKQYERESVGTKRTIRPASNLSRAVRAVLFSFTLLALLSLGSTLLPTAKILIEPMRDRRLEVMHLPFAPGSESDGSSYAREDRVRVEGSIRIATSGISSEPGDFASGFAEFTNLSDEVVSIPAGTTIRPAGSEQLYFITQSRLILPAELEAARSVEILASLPGPSGNIPAGRINAVDGSLGLLVSVQNPEATTGGSVISRRAVNASDLETARDQLRQQLIERAGEIIEANQSSSEELVPGTMDVDTTLFEEYDRRIGETADTVQLEMGVIVQATIADLEEIKSSITDILFPPSNAGLQIIPGSVEIQSVELVDSTTQAGSNFQIQLSYELFDPLDRRALARDLRGMRPLIAQRFLADNYPQNMFVVDLVPTWYPILPLYETQFNLMYPWEVQG